MSGGDLAWVALGGALGALCRHGVLAAGRAWSARAGRDRAVAAVLVANVLACLLLGALAGREGSRWALALGVGAAGALSTFSTLGLQLHRLVRERRRGAAAALVGATLALGLAGLALGRAVASVTHAVGGAA